uniref:Uncharacterized protein n=1 Tax=Timema monikensis TaxID=170555 RepID=A0A7R9EI73_9NEOP|nr:unnamed protein product [Timema monikensis]
MVQGQLRAAEYEMKWYRVSLMLPIMFLVSAAVSCVVLYFATSWYLVLLLAFFFVCFIAVSSSLLNSSVVDIFPTSLRAMAVCLTLMAGRTGVVGGSLMIGALIDTHCSLAFVVLSGVALQVSEVDSHQNEMHNCVHK